MNKIFIPMLIFATLLNTAGFSYAADGSTTASVAKDAVVKDKLDDILATQKKILAQLDEMKQELYVIKVRSTKH